MISVEDHRAGGVRSVVIDDLEPAAIVPVVPEYIAAEARLLRGELCHMKERPATCGRGLFFVRIIRRKPRLPPASTRDLRLGSGASPAPAVHSQRCIEVGAV